MKLKIKILLVLVLFFLTNIEGFKVNQLRKQSRCRFARDFTTQQILQNPDKLNDFLRTYVQWQSKFIHQIGVDAKTGLTLDGIRVDVKTGEAIPSTLHKFTASSKESIHLGIMAAVLEGSQFADEIYTPNEVFELIEKKTQTLEQFYKDYPGFAGFLPWVTVDEKGVHPTHDFKSRVPALDNGEMFWAAFALSKVWQQKYPNILPRLRDRFDDVYWRKMVQNIRKVFFNETTGKIRAVANIKDVKQSPQENVYTNSDDYYLDDPYEGELFTWIATFSIGGRFTQDQIDFIWQDKRKKLQPTYLHVKGPCLNITAEKGWWFSSHQQWKNLYLPYYLSQTYFWVQYNNQLARTWNSFENGIPGMYGAMAGPAETNEQDTGYFVAGIEELAFQKVEFDSLVTPYGAFPLLLINKEYGAAWLHNTVYSPCGQTKYGALEGTGLNGTLMSPTLTWDTKITTVLAILNGTKSILTRYLENKNLLDTFVSRVEQEYSRAFPLIDGSWLDPALPGNKISQGRPDFTTCK